MENLSLVPQETAANCAYCTTAVISEDVFCNNCGYPLKASEFEQKTFLANKEIQQADLYMHEESVRKAGNTLFWVAGSFVLFGFVMYAMDKTGDASILLATNIILAVIFLVLGFWSRSKPVAALITGLSLYGLIIILNAIVEPMSIIKGVIVKIVIIIFLIKGLRAAMEAEKIRKAQ